MKFTVGQRWLSETQPELGLGLVTGCDGAGVQVRFPASGENFTFALRGAPLRRVAFGPGDSVKDQSGESFVIVEVREQEGCLVYIDDQGRELPEIGLCDSIGFQKPQARLVAALVDSRQLWSLRQRTLQQWLVTGSRGVRGLLGGRVSLIPHQLYIAHEVANRFAPRVLLADEVGLGKTIEACLILHRLYLSGRAHRILILVPDALVNQWFVELFRRFSLSFSIFDEERALAIEGGGEGSDNPFLDEQLVLCATSWLAGDARRAEQAAAAGWDLLIVDEAHHLEWTSAQASPAYRAVERVARKTPGLLLLTATPEQLGREGHFARLQLLDPDRFSDLEEFVEECGHFREVSALADRLRSGAALASDETDLLDKLLGAGTGSHAVAASDPKHREELTSRLVDLHGTGRVMFRNRRSVLEGFPARLPHLYGLENPKDRSPDAVKIDWIASMLNQLPGEKFVLICHSEQTAIGIDEALTQTVSTTATALFHEGLSLLQRDRNAAWFADADGARILVCSEIGSEGRNFQFAHHLILYDLPPDPALLEQRIGRLDRIGQSSEIHIHVPYLLGTPEELWAIWYDQGLGAFSSTLHGSREILKQFGTEMADLSLPGRAWEEALPGLVERTREAAIAIDTELEAGRNHLLEISSHHPAQGQSLREAIEAIDEDRQLQRYFLRLVDHFGVTVEDLGESEFLLKPENLFDAEAFPGLPTDGLSITFDREVALAREELVFLTWDHPMVLSAMESLLASDAGNAAFLRIRGAPEQALLVEAVFVIECVAPPRLHAERFLPPTPVAVLIDHHGKERSKQFGGQLLARAATGEVEWLRKNAGNLRAVLPAMMAAAEQRAEKLAGRERQAALVIMAEKLDAEIGRLEKLRELGHPIREDEMALALGERQALDEAIRQAPLRTDCVRLIMATP
jgi:ATP-dependent helicase HepA